MPNGDYTLKQQSERILATIDGWAVASDGIQWILLRQRSRKTGPFWNPVSFVRSTRDILARCMREKGVDERSARFLLSGLPPSFDEWKSSSLPLTPPSDPA
jgi:hypothetical protein